MQVPTHYAQNRRVGFCHGYYHLLSAPAHPSRLCSAGSRYIFDKSTRANLFPPSPNFFSPSLDCIWAVHFANERSTHDIPIMYQKQGNLHGQTDVTPVHRSKGPTTNPNKLTLTTWHEQALKVCKLWRQPQASNSGSSISDADWGLWRSFSGCVPLPDAAIVRQSGTNNQFVHVVYRNTGCRTMRFG